MSLCYKPGCCRWSICMCEVVAVATRRRGKHTLTAWTWNSAQHARLKGVWRKQLTWALRLLAWHTKGQIPAQPQVEQRCFVDSQTIFAIFQTDLYTEAVGTEARGSVDGWTALADAQHGPVPWSSEATELRVSADGGWLVSAVLGAEGPRVRRAGGRLSLKARPAILPSSPAPSSLYVCSGGLIIQQSAMWHQPQASSLTETFHVV